MSDIQIIEPVLNTTRVEQKLNEMQERKSSDLRKEVDFREHYIGLNDMVAVPTEGYKPSRGRGSLKNLLSTKIEFKGDSFTPSQRFWTSFCAKVGVGTNVFNLFSHDEVFNRVVRDNKFSSTGGIRVIEDIKHKRLLAITDPAKPVVDWSSLLKLIGQKDGYDCRYSSDGIITSMHSLDSDLPVKVGGEDFKQRISVHVPIDGYGSPAVYLALLREICSNGMVAMSKAFKTSINVGKRDTSDDIEYSLQRMFDSFSNDEGFDALIRRLDAARRAKLSVREFEQAQRHLSRITPQERDPTKELQISEELRKFSTMAGSLHSKYGLSHLQQMTDKQMALLETDMTVYETVNYLTEVTTHRLNPMSARDNDIKMKLHGWVGSLIARPYDLEGTIDAIDVKDESRPRYFPS